MTPPSHAIEAPVADPVAIPSGNVDRAAKRLIDLLVTSVILIITAPISLLVAVAIKLDSRGPVLYRSRRVGMGGRPLDMLKFRKMRDDASGPGLTVSDDDRFTRIGRLLARSKLDEVPQFLNVLRGEMSLVGPRPEDPAFVALMPEEFDEILATTRPGMTGLCQLAFADEPAVLNGHDRVSFYVDRLLPQKVELDLLYARRRTVAMDLRILLWTVVAIVLRRPVAVDRATGRLGLRRRPTSQPAPIHEEERR